MTEKRQTSTAECKRAAVRLGTAQRDSVVEPARHLGIHVHMRRRWKQAQTVHTSAALPGKGRLTPEQAARRQRRDEVKRRRLERNILNKALRCFVNELRCGIPAGCRPTSRGQWRCAVRCAASVAAGFPPPCSVKAPPGGRVTPSQEWRGCKRWPGRRGTVRGGAVWPSRSQTSAMPWDESRRGS